MTGASDKNCAFCDVVASNVPAHVVASDDFLVAFLDHRPLFPGHVLVAPKQHVETLPDLAAEEISPLFEFVQRLSVAVQAAMKSEGTFVAVNNTVSQSVPHLHVHVVPRSKGDGLRGFFWPRSKYVDDAHAARVRDSISSALGEART